MVRKTVLERAQDAEPRAEKHREKLEPKVPNISVDLRALPGNSFTAHVRVLLIHPDTCSEGHCSDSSDDEVTMQEVISIPGHQSPPLDLETEIVCNLIVKIAVVTVGGCSTNCGESAPSSCGFRCCAAVKLHICATKLSLRTDVDRRPAKRPRTTFVASDDE